MSEQTGSRVHADVQRLLSDLGKEEKWIGKIYARAKEDEAEYPACLSDLRASEDRLNALTEEAAAVRSRLKAGGKGWHKENVNALDSVRHRLRAALKTMEARRPGMLQAQSGRWHPGKGDDPAAARALNRWISLELEVVELIAEWDRPIRLEEMIQRRGSDPAVDTELTELEGSIDGTADALKKLCAKMETLAADAEEDSDLRSKLEGAVESAGDHLAAVQRIGGQLSSGAVVKKLGSGRKGIEEVREELPQQLKRDPELLEQVAKREGGRDLLGRLVESCQKVKRSIDNNRVIQGVFKACFKISRLTLSGSLNSVLHVYQALNHVPVSSEPMLKPVRHAPDKRSGKDEPERLTLKVDRSSRNKSK